MELAQLPKQTVIRLRWAPSKQELAAALGKVIVKQLRRLFNCE